MAVLQGVLAVVDSDLHRFNTVNLATTVSSMAKLRPLPDMVARAVQRPAFNELKTAISAPLACAKFLPLLSAKPCAPLRAVTEAIPYFSTAYASLAVQRAGRTSCRPVRRPTSCTGLQ